MAKKNHSIKFTRGLLDIGTMSITESDKNGEYLYDFLEALREFDGKYVNISITEENPVIPKDMKATPDAPDDPEEE